MSGASVAALLADLIEPAGFAVPLPTPAKAAKAANRKHWRGVAADPSVCEGLRIPASPGASVAQDAADSQTFAALRKTVSAAGSEERRGSSQDSQDSLWSASTRETAPAVELAAVAWTDGDIARFLDRRARLLRWGWSEPNAEALAERLTRRDREADDRVSCADCRHFRPWRCCNHRRAGLQSAEIGSGLAGLLQCCDGFNERDE